MKEKCVKVSLIRKQIALAQKDMRQIREEATGDDLDQLFSGQQEAIVAKQEVVYVLQGLLALAE
jgi:hypothetical protein